MKSNCATHALWPFLRLCCRARAFFKTRRLFRAKRCTGGRTQRESTFPAIDGATGPGASVYGSSPAISPSPSPPVIPVARVFHTVAGDTVSLIVITSLLRPLRRLCAEDRGERRRKWDKNGLRYVWVMLRNLLRYRVIETRSSNFRFARERFSRKIVREIERTLLSVALDKVPNIRSEKLSYKKL